MLPVTASCLPLVRYCAIVSPVLPKAMQLIKSVSSFLKGLVTAKLNLVTAVPLPAAKFNSGSLVSLPISITLLITISPLTLLV